MVSQHNAVVALFFDYILSAKCLTRKRSFADICKDKLVMHRNVTRKQVALFPKTVCSSRTKLINSFQTVHLHEIKITSHTSHYGVWHVWPIYFIVSMQNLIIMSHTSHYGVWRVWPIYFIVSVQNLISTKIINGINVFRRSKSKIIWNAVKNHLIKHLQNSFKQKNMTCVSHGASAPTYILASSKKIWHVWIMVHQLPLTF